MASRRSSVRSNSPTCSSLGTEDVNLVVAAMDEAEAAARGNPSCSGSGGASAPPVNPVDGHAPVNPPMDGDCPAAVCSALGPETPWCSVPGSSAGPGSLSWLLGLLLSVPAWTPSASGSSSPSP